LVVGPESGDEDGFAHGAEEGFDEEIKVGFGRRVELKIELWLLGGDGGRHGCALLKRSMIEREVQVCTV
jgi:hypothetical protein